ncbi:MAG: glycosyltransferase family 61 protein, partial [Rhodobacteraceae bacterium]|nr:glycosyltransferase family 61 protein [Paracoccaceae bacterium]
ARATLPVRGLQDVAREAGNIYRSYAEAEPTSIAAPQIIGQPPAPATQISARALFLAGLRDTVVYGVSNLRRDAGGLIADLQPGDLSRWAVHWAADPVVTDWHGSRAAIEVPRRAPVHIDTAIDLVGPFSLAWGHSIMDFAPRLLMALSDPDCPADAPLLIDKAAMQPHRDLMAYLSGGRQVIDLFPPRPVQVGRLWTASTPEFTPVWPSPGQRFTTARCTLSPAPLARVLAMAPQISVDHDLPKKIFLDRSPGFVRQIANHDAVAARLARAGYTRILPEKLDVQTQLKLAAGATHIAGPYGSNLLLPMMLGNPSAQVVILHPDDLEEKPLIMATAQARGQDVRVVCGPSAAPDPRMPGNSNFTVPLDHLDVALRDNA